MFYVVIMTTAWNLIEWRLLSRIHRVPRIYAFVTLTTVVVGVFLKFTSAILIGLVISVLTRARALERLAFSQLISTPLLDRMILEAEQTTDEADPFEVHSGLVVFPDRVSVASARELTRIVGQDIADSRVVIFDFSKSVHMDDTAASMLGQLVATVVAERSEQFVIVGLTGDAENMLNSMDLLADVPAGNFAADMVEAKRIVRPMLLRCRTAAAATSPLHVLE